MSPDESDVREHLARIAASVHYSVDSPRLLAEGRRRQRRRRAALLASAGLVLAIGVTVVASLVLTGPGQHRPAVDRPQRLAPLTDVSATPGGWSPVAYLDGQVSVPSGWLIEDPEWVCGGHGLVFVNEPAQQPPAGMGCDPTDNIVVIRPAAKAAVPHGHPATVNDVPVVLGSTTSGDQTTYLERGLGLDVTATGPFAQQILATLTHSPQSVVLNSTGVPAPAAWRSVTFGGLRFSVPPSWKIGRASGWPGCPYNLAPQRLALVSADAIFTPGCPAPPSTAEYNAGVPGLVVAAGKQVSADNSIGDTCMSRDSLRICVDSSPAPSDAYQSGRGLSILTALVYLPGQSRPDQIELGLYGTGLTAAQVFDSIRPAR